MWLLDQFILIGGLTHARLLHIYTCDLHQTTKHKHCPHCRVRNRQSKLGEAKWFVWGYTVVRGIHILIYLTLSQVLTPQNQKHKFFKGSLVYSLALTWTLALWRRLKFGAASLMAGSLSYSNKVYSKRAGTSWHMALGANTSESARQNSLDWQLFLCPAVQWEMSSKVA